MPTLKKSLTDLEAKEPQKSARDMTKIFITGASGYLGSTFLSYIPSDWDIIAFDSKKPSVKLPKNFTFTKGDIIDDSRLPNLLKDVDIVLHFAAIKGSEQCRKNPMQTIEVNVIGTHKLLKAAAINNVKKFIFASTYWVYGDNQDLPFTEEIPVSPSDLYGLSKAISETEVAASEIDYIILRFTNIFGLGSGIKPEEVIFNLIKSAFDRNQIVLHGGGSQKLDFIHIEDACKCLLKIITNQKISRSILNVGSGQPRSISSIARIISNIFQQRYKKTVTLISSPAGDRQIHDRWVSTSKLEEKIGKLDLKPFELSIELYIQDYKGKFL